MSTEPTDEVLLSDKYAVMTNMWSSAQVRHRGRLVYVTNNSQRIRGLF